MLSELSEAEARADIAHIYGEIRRLCAVPYVSSLQRHLATRDGWLPWVWSLVRHAFEGGEAQSRAWRVVGDITPVSLAPLSDAQLALLAVDDKALRSIRGVYASFVRVSPTNLMMAGLLRRYLEGQTPQGIANRQAAWQPPPALPELPKMVDLSTVAPPLREVLLGLGNDVDGQLFVPGLYRMLAHWPAYLAHVACQLTPLFADSQTKVMCQRIRDQIDQQCGLVFDALGANVNATPSPPRADYPQVLDVLQRYGTTSAQMIVFARALGDALPPSAA